MSNGVDLTRYAYWSERAVRRVAGDLGIVLNRSRRTKLSGGFKLPFVDVRLDLECGSRDLLRNEVANRLERVIGEHAVDDFVSPPKAKFAKGVSRLEFSHFICDEGGRVVMNTHAVSSDGTHVGFALFGSVDNLPGWTGVDDRQPAGWTSSSMWGVLEWLASNCAKHGRGDDPEYLAVEALKIADSQGKNEYYETHPDKPWTRGFTFADADDAEWLVEVYWDVVLDRDRWSPDDHGDRIVVGAPLWIRTPTSGFRRYRDQRRHLNEDEPMKRWHAKR